jgi:hypothetical protein
MSGGGRPQAAQQIVQRHVPLAHGRPAFAVPGGDYHRFPLTLSSPADAAAAAASRGSSVGGGVEEEIVIRTPVSCRSELYQGAILLPICLRLGFFVRIGREV